MPDSELNSPLLSIRSIIKLVSLIILLPCYIYAICKWYQFKTHFLIQKRFPKISIILCIIAFLGVIISVIEDLCFDVNISNNTIDSNVMYLVLSLTFSISGLVLYRINLIYLKWKSLQPLLIPTKHEFTRANNNSDSSSLPSTQIVVKSSISINKSIPRKSSPVMPQIGIKSSSFSLDPKLNTRRDSIINQKEHPITEKINKAHKHHTLYASNLSIIILFFIFIGTVIAYASYTMSLSVDVAYLIVVIEFAVLWIFTLLSIVNIKHKKVAEGQQYVAIYIMIYIYIILCILAYYTLCFILLFSFFCSKQVLVVSTNVMQY